MTTEPRPSVTWPEITPLPTDTVRKYALNRLRHLLSDCTGHRVWVISRMMLPGLPQWKVWCKYSYRGREFDFTQYLYQREDGELDAVPVTVEWEA